MARRRRGITGRAGDGRCVRDGQSEPPQVSDGGGGGGCRCGHCCAGHRPDQADHRVAAGVQLPEVARYDLRRRRNVRQGAARDVGRQFPRARIRADGNRARPRRRRRGAPTAASRRATRPPITTGARIRRSPSAPRCHSASTAACRMRGCIRAAASTCSTSSMRATRSIALPGGNTGTQMGGWYPQARSTRPRICADSRCASAVWPAR